jgi:hypothetical protein
METFDTPQGHRLDLEEIIRVGLSETHYDI